MLRKLGVKSLSPFVNKKSISYFCNPPRLLNVTRNPLRCLSTESHKKEGLFSIPGLHQPPDFLTAASNAISECNSLREIIRNSLTDSPLSPHETLYVLDSISNAVCSVIDASELCRSVHSSPEWRHSAGQAFQLLSEYIAELNADASLHASLVPITSNPEVMANLTEEERRMAILLQKEFERDGIHLPDAERVEIQKLSGFVTQLETLFSENLMKHSTFDVIGRNAQDAIRTIPFQALSEAVPQTHSDMTSMTLSTEPHIANSILKYSTSPSLRKEVYMQVNTASPENLEVLDALAMQRHLLAAKMGYPSYAHYFLSDKMAKNPDNVKMFLNKVKDECNDKYQEDVAMLTRVKREMEGNSEELHAWDWNHYTGLVKSHLFDDVGMEEGSGNSLHGYFTVEQSIEGMKFIVKKLFGIVMDEVPLRSNECWDLDSIDRKEDPSSSRIQKFELYEEEDEKPLGTIYLDLYPREGKYTHSAHFTVRCGCKLRKDSSDDEFQLPVVALVCNLSPMFSSSDAAAMLSHSEVETLFHEFGHALHSLLSRTSFQHLSGTRAAMDFVETPSHLMEYYVWNKEFLRVIGKHHQTGQGIPEKVMETLIKSRHAFKAMETRTQVVYCQFDQVIFGPPENWRGIKTTTDVFASLSKGSSLPYVEGTHWHTRFGHLVTYGAGYYSYLYAAMFSADLWTTCFNAGGNAFNRKAGTKYWKEILIHGGSKDPNLMLKNMLGREPQVASFFNILRS